MTALNKEIKKYISGELEHLPLNKVVKEFISGERYINGKETDFAEISLPSAQRILHNNGFKLKKLVKRAVYGDDLRVMNYTNKTINIQLIIRKTEYFEYVSTIYVSKYMDHVYFDGKDKFNLQTTAS